MAAVDYEHFFRAVIAFATSKPQGEAYFAELGVDPGVKSAWQGLGLSKAKKMSMVLDTRPDLFSRSTTDKGGAKFQLEPLALDCASGGPIPPIHPALAATVTKKATTASAIAPILPFCFPPPPPDVFSPSGARKYFLKVLLMVLASQPEMKADTSQLGQVEEVKQAWKAGGLNSKYKMIEILKERPDILFILKDPMNTTAIIHLTELGAICAQSGHVPDPDHTCPPQSTPKSAIWGPGGVRREGMENVTRPMPYASASSHLPAAPSRFRPQTAVLPAPMPVGVVSDATVAATKRAEAGNPRIGLHSGTMAAPSAAVGSFPAFGAACGHGAYGVGGYGVSGGYGGYGGYGPV